ncbi:LysR family transcriptional regulator [Herbaspirillum frisingense]|nr:LysR family transcriptional regulator [Herbaspirillum frisingense]
MRKLGIDDLARMATFARVVELGAFSRAAKALGLTTSSVSQHVRMLELSLQATLLNRSTRKLSLTEAGTLFYKHCAHIVTAASEAEQSVAVLNNEMVGELRIAVSSFMSTRYLIPALHDFIKHNPKIKLRFEVADHNIDLIDHRIDLALRAGRNRQPGDIFLGRFADVLCASPEYLESRPPIHSPVDLLQHDFLLFNPHGEPCFLEFSNEAAGTVRVRLQPRISANHARSLRFLALDGHGIARLLHNKIGEDLQSGRLRQVLPQWSLGGFDIFVTVRHRDNMPAKVRQCLDHIEHYFASILPLHARSACAAASG